MAQPVSTFDSEHNSMQTNLFQGEHSCQLFRAHEPQQELNPLLFIKNISCKEMQHEPLAKN